MIRVDKKQHLSPLDGKFKKQRRKKKPRHQSKAHFILPKASWLTVGDRIRVEQKVLGLSLQTLSACDKTLRESFGFGQSTSDKLAATGVDHKKKTAKV